MLFGQFQFAKNKKPCLEPKTKNRTIYRLAD